MHGLLGIALRVTIIYWYALLVLRLSGKRSVGSLSAIDLVVGLIIGDMFDDVIWAEIPLAQGLVGMTSIVFLHSLVAWASWKSKRVDQLVNSTPTRVVKNGKILVGNLQRERTPAAEVEMSLRLNGDDNLAEIQEACWEQSGSLSLRKIEAAQPVQKRDLAALRKVT